MGQADARRKNHWIRSGVELASKFIPIPMALVLWELVARSGAFNAELFPPPSAVWFAFLEMAENGELWRDLLASGTRAGVGYLLGCVAGVAVGVATGRVRLFDLGLSQIIHILRAFPPVALVPFAILWFGLAESSKYFLVFWGVFFPVWVSTHAGMSSVDKTYLWAARSLGANRRHEILDVLLPAALSHVLAGMRVAIGICFICVFVAEMAGAYEGIGFRISTSYLVFRVDKMMASLLLLGALGSISDAAFKGATGRLFPWIALGNTQPR